MKSYKQLITEIATKTLTEGFSIDKDNKVTHDDHPATKAFAKEYTRANKRDHRPGGPTEADELHSDAFDEKYESKSTRSGFAGSGTHVYTHRKTGQSFKVDRNPSGRGFYGTDHYVTHHAAGVNEEADLNEAKMSAAQQGWHDGYNGHPHDKKTRDIVYVKANERSEYTAGHADGQKARKLDESTQLSEESLLTGTRKISSHEGKDGHHAEIRYNKDQEEYQVHHFRGGKHLGEGPISYHSDKEEAQDQVAHDVKHFRG